MRWGKWKFLEVSSFAKNSANSALELDKRRVRGVYAEAFG